MPRCDCKAGVTQKKLAEKIGIGEPLVHRKVKNGSFVPDEAQKSTDVLKIEKSENHFFAEEVT